MEERVLKLLQAKRKEYERKEDQIKSFSKNPLILFDGLMYEREIIPNLLYTIDEKLLLEYQAWQYPLVEKALTDNFKLAPFTIGWDAELFPSPLYLLSNGYPVVQIQPYLQTFEILPVEEVSVKVEEFKMFSKERINKWEEYNEALIRSWNPFIDTDESLTKALKVSLTKKKRVKENQVLQEQLLFEYNQLVEQCHRIELQIQNIEQAETTNNYDIEKIYQQMRLAFPLKLVNLHNDLLVEANEDIATWEHEAQERINELENKAITTEQL